MLTNAKTRHASRLKLYVGRRNLMYIHISNLAAAAPEMSGINALCVQKLNVLSLLAQEVRPIPLVMYSILQRTIVSPTV